MNTGILVLCFISSLAGFMMVVGGIWLIYKEKIYIDKKSNKVIEIQTPIFGKFKTNIPAIALFGMGFIPLIYPIVQLTPYLKTDVVKISGNVRSSSHPVLIHAVIKSEPLQSDRNYSFEIPVLQGGSACKLLYVVGDFVDEEYIDMAKAKNGEIVIKEKDINLPEIIEYEPQLLVKNIPSEFRSGGVQ